MSVAKDAERIGDYCKNVFEVGRFYDEDFNVPSYHDPLETIRADVEALFRLVRDAWHDSDPDKATAPAPQPSTPLAPPRIAPTAGRE